MDIFNTCEDDLLDSMEMCDNIESYINELLNDCDLHIALSAMMTASAHCLIQQAQSLEEAQFLKNFFSQLLDLVILSNLDKWDDVNE